MATTAEVIIVGGGVMGSAVAYFLRGERFPGRVLVIEPDPLYQRASSALSFGGIRQQYSTAVNVQISRASVAFYERFGELMEVDGDRPTIEFHQRGYLFLAGPQEWGVFQRRHALQRSLGVEVELLRPEEILKVVPDMNVEGLAGASFGPRDGYLDPYSVLRGFARKARALGAVYLTDEVVAIGQQGGRVTGVRTAKGEEIAGPVVVNAAGPWAGTVGRMAGVEIPVEPIRRQVYACAPARPLGYDLPLVIDTTGMYFRSEPGGRILAGKSKPEDPHIFDWTWQTDHFYDQVWPDLAARVPPFERLRLERGWAGLYDMNVADHNAIIGEHPGMGGFYCINGFSGHGFQQAPAAGRALAELIRLGRFATLDLTALGPGRFAEGRLVMEEAVI